MEPRFRIATALDLDTVLQFMHEFFVEDQLPDQRPYDALRARSALEDLVNDPTRGRVLLVCDGDVAVGYLALTFGYSLEFHGRDAFIDELYIRASSRGRGWGTQAIRHAEAIAHAEHIRAIHLEVGRHNVAAQALYRRLGYADHDRYLMTRWITR